MNDVCPICKGKIIHESEGYTNIARCENSCIIEKLLDNGDGWNSHYSLNVKGKIWRLIAPMHSETWSEQVNQIHKQAGLLELNVVL